ncbi:MAG: FadR family transcriptional regulator [Desulfobacterales bacterium]|nr:MAG: FadR family transcriptional regulator [Desulfobacterales bacterium]
MPKDSKSPFTRVTQAGFKKKSSLIAEQILHLIKTGVYEPASKLPPERLIAEQMNVGRPSVREAISALHIAGVLESRPGDGTYVAASPMLDFPVDNTLSVLEESESPFEVLQARKAMEIGVIHLAIKNATEEDIQRIKAAWVKKRDNARRGNYAEFIRHGREFHRAIAEATGSRAIVGLTEGLLKMTHQSLWVHMREQYYRQDNRRIEPMIKLHDDIVKAIENRNSQKAIELIEKHYDIQIDQHYHDVGDTADLKKE